MPGLWRGEPGRSCRHEPSAGVSWWTSHARPGSPHEGCEVGQPLSGRRAAPLPPAPCQHRLGSGAGPPPPAGRARRSAGRRPGRVVSSPAAPRRAARPRGDSPAGARAPLPPFHRSHFSCTKLRGDRGGAAGPAARRTVRAPRGGKGGRPGRAGRGFPGLPACASSTGWRARSGSPQPSEGDLGEKGNFW